MKLFKIIASQGGRVIFDDRLEAPTPREARNQMRALLGMRSLTGVVYSLTEIPVELIGQIAESKVADALRRFGEGTPPPSLEETIRVAAAEEVRRQLAELRAETLTAAPSSNGANGSNGHHPRFDPFSGGDSSSLSEPELARVRSHAQRQLTEIREQLNGAPRSTESVVAQVRGQVEERRRRQPRGRPAMTTDGRAIDWKSVKKLYLRNRSHKQTAAAFDLSVNTVKARARKEGWAQ
jgi:hypothetical protein